MASRVDRVNRAVLTLVGLLLLVAGLAALAIGFGVFGEWREERPVLPQQLSDFIHDNPWYWWAVALVCVLAAVVTLRWLLAQLHTSRLSQLEVEPDRTAGSTLLRTSGVADAVTQDAESIRGVRSASMRVVGTEATHRHQLTVYLDGRADITEVRERLVSETVANLRRALDFDEPQVDLRLVVAARGRRDVD